MDVLVIEDDAAIAVPLVSGLRREGYEATSVSTGEEGLAAAGDAELVLLDLGLPDMDGYDVCRRIRADSSVPIIVITARGDEVDRVIGLELGADDYIVKPFGFRELVARIRAVTRRMSASDDAERDALAEISEIGDLAVDRRVRRVTIDGREIALTRKEFDLLELLARDPGATLTRDHIMEQVWDAHWYGPTKTLDVHVATLRKKLGQGAAIETIRGVGFRLGEP